MRAATYMTSSKYEVWGRWCELGVNIRDWAHWHLEGSWQRKISWNARWTLVSNLLPLQSCCFCMIWPYSRRSCLPSDAKETLLEKWICGRGLRFPWCFKLPILHSKPGIHVELRRLKIRLPGIDGNAWLGTSRRLACRRGLERGVPETEKVLSNQALPESNEFQKNGKWSHHAKMQVATRCMMLPLGCPAKLIKTFAKNCPMPPCAPIHAASTLSHLNSMGARVRLCAFAWVSAFPSNIMPDQEGGLACFVTLRLLVASMQNVYNIRTAFQVFVQWLGTLVFWWFQYRGHLPRQSNSQRAEIFCSMLCLDALLGYFNCKYFSHFSLF